MDTEKTAIRGVACALAGGILWGFSGTCTQFLTTTYQMPAAFITWFRMTVAGALLLVYLLVRQRSKLVAILHDRHSLVQLVIYAIVGLALGQYAYTSCTRYTDAGTATVLQCIGTVMLIVYTCLRARKAPRPIEIVATMLALSATFLIATQGDPASLSLPLAGLAWGLANAFSCAFFAGYPKRLLDRWGSLSVMGAGMLIGSVLMLPMAHPWDIHLELDAMSVTALLSVAVLGTFVSFALFLQGVKDLGSVKASLLGVIEPVSATFFSWALMGTRFSMIDLMGFTMMIAMVALVSVAKPSEDVSDDTAKPATPASASVAQPAWKVTGRPALKPRVVNGISADHAV